MLKITPLLNNLITLSIVLLLLGIIFVNRVLIMLSLTPLLFMLLALLVGVPREITIKKLYPQEILLAGDSFTIEISIEIKRGLGTIVVFDLLPGEFELREGSNLKLLWKGFRPLKTTLRYRVRSTTAGYYQLNKPACEAYHFLHLKAPVNKAVSASQKIEIRPRVLEIKKIRDVTTKSKIPLPLGAVAKMGLPTLEFREMRQYQRGDPYKFINWKATARNTGGAYAAPLVNEYEKEGKKTVWLFLDHSSAMYFGANVQNVFESALEAVNGFVDYYTKYDCRIALCTFNGAPFFIYPAAGKRQYYKILQELLRLKTRENDSSKERGEENGAEPEKPQTGKRATLRETVIRYKGYLYGNNPLCIVVTRINRENTSALDEGIRELMKYTSIRKESYSVMVVNIDGYDLAASTPSEKVAAEILRKRDRINTGGLKRGITWIDWNPTRSSFTTTLLRQVVRR